MKFSGVSIVVDESFIFEHTAFGLVYTDLSLLDFFFGLSAENFSKI